MKKRIKVLAVLSTAMFMTAITLDFIGTASTVYTENIGWTEENGNWYCYDSYSEVVADTWKENGDDWYHLDSGGTRAADRQIDGYYVGEDGRRVGMKWISMKNEDFWDEDDTPEFLYYYYGRDGKTLISRWVSINGGWYYSNEDGIIQAGSITVDGYNYYLGEDGGKKTGQILMADETDDPEYIGSWYYFDNTGERIENEVDRRADGQYCTFVDGRMQTGWYKPPVRAAAEPGEAQTATPSEAVLVPEQTVAGYRCYDEDGERASGWKIIGSVEGFGEEAELYRFYFKGDKPYHTEEGPELLIIDSRKCISSTEDEVQTGKEVVNLEDDNVVNFYFSEEGVIKTGKQVILDGNLGGTRNWYFHTDDSRRGQGFHGIKDNVLYVYGLCREADKDLRFASVELNSNQYLVNSNDAVQEATPSSKPNAMPEPGSGYKDFKDENDRVWTVNTEGAIQSQNTAQ